MLPSYTTVRFFGEIEAAENLTVRLDLDNAFDKQYYTNSYADVWVGPAPLSGDCVLRVLDHTDEAVAWLCQAKAGGRAQLRVDDEKER